MNQEVQRTAKEKFWEEKVVRKGQWCRRKGGGGFRGGSWM